MEDPKDLEIERVFKKSSIDIDLKKEILQKIDINKYQKKDFNFDFKQKIIKNMKTQYKIFIGTLILIVLGLLTMFMLTPKFNSEHSSGTFAKSEKYHKSQLTEKDVQLRSEFVSDTAKLKNMIQGLIYFSIYTQDLSNKIDSCVYEYEKCGICKNSNCSNIDILKEYSEFIKNNNKTLNRTISILTSFYLEDYSEQFTDVDNDLRNFANYVTYLTVKDSIFESSLKDMDNFLIQNKTLSERKSEIKKLKSFRDQLILGAVGLSGLIQDSQLANSVLTYALNAVGNSVILNDKLDNVILAEDKLGTHWYGSNDNFGNQFYQGTENIGSVYQVIVYNSENLQFSSISANEISSILSNSEIQAVAVVGDQLNVIMNNSSLNVNIQILNNVELSNILQNSQLGNSFIGLVESINSSVLGVVDPL